MREEKEAKAKSEVKAIDVKEDYVVVPASASTSSAVSGIALSSSSMGKARGPQLCGPPRQL